MTCKYTYGYDIRPPDHPTTKGREQMSEPIKQTATPQDALGRIAESQSAAMANNEPIESRLIGVRNLLRKAPETVLKYAAEQPDTISVKQGITNAKAKYQAEVVAKVREIVNAAIEGRAK